MGRTAGSLGKQDMTLLEAPPTELRQHIKRLAIEGKWSELLEAAENCMSLPAAAVGWIFRSSLLMPVRDWAATIPGLRLPFVVN